MRPLALSLAMSVLLVDVGQVRGVTVMAAEWYLRIGGAQLGPFSSAKLRQLAQERKVKPDTLVKKGEDGKWVRASNVKGLFEVGPPPPIPQPEVEDFVQPQVVADPEAPPLQSAQPQQDVNRGFRLGIGVAIGCACGLLLVLGAGLTILVIIGLWGVKSYEPIRRSAYIKATETQIKAFKIPLQAYRLDIGDFPSTSQGLESLLAPPSDLPDQDKWFGSYLNSDVVPLDPWDNPYQYEYPSKRQESWPDIWSFGPDGEDNSDDDICSWFLWSET